MDALPQESIQSTITHFQIILKIINVNIIKYNLSFRSIRLSVAAIEPPYEKTCRGHAREQLGQNSHPSGPNLANNGGRGK